MSKALVYAVTVMYLYFFFWIACGFEPLILEVKFILWIIGVSALIDIIWDIVDEYLL